MPTDWETPPEDSHNEDFLTAYGCLINRATSHIENEDLLRLWMDWALYEEKLG
jgi:hypothetical protein